jgi:hypothetical protein
MEIAPIQRLAPPAAPTIPAATGIRSTPAVRSAQAGAPAADQQQARSRPAPQDSMRVLVSWHPHSLGYVTKVVDQHSGAVLHQSPPEMVIAMVLQVIARLEGAAA